jgi:HAD superfamily hydrolase (TIGR01456 family)
MKRIPGIFCDIDGVLLRGKKKIPRSDFAFKYIRQSLSQIDPKNYGSVKEQIPFMCLTNGGGKLEQHKAEEVNVILGVEKDVTKKLNKENVVVNFSPLRPILKEYGHKTVMISGVGNIKMIAEDCGLKNFITCDEYCALFPSLVPISKRNLEDRYRLLPQIQQRFGLKDQALFDEPFQIDAVFILHDVNRWEENAQIMLDLVSSTNGKIPHKYPTKAMKPHIPVWIVNNDFMYADEFNLPRLAFGPYTLALKTIYNKLYGEDMHINMCGKPERITFEYAKIEAQKLTRTPIGNCYMIGDNPEGDIRGANQMNWTSILVKTGVHKEEGNSTLYPATHVVNDFYDAVKLILEKENIHANLEYNQNH